MTARRIAGLDRAEWRALLLAPLTAPLGYFAAIGVGAVARWLGSGTSGMSVTGAIRVLGLVLATGAPIAYLTMLIGGLPAYLLLRRGGRAGRGPLWTTGAALGALVAAVLGPALRGDLFSIPFPTWGGALLGLATAEAFWRLLRRGRAPPDRGPEASRAEPPRADGVEQPRP